MARSFWVTWHLTQVPRMTPKYLNSKRSKVPRIQVTATRESQISLRFVLWPGVLGPKWPLNTNRSKVPHILVTTTSQSQISLHFALQPSVLELLAILRQMHWMTPKWPWALKGQRFPIYIHVTTSLEFQNGRYQLYLQMSLPTWLMSLSPFSSASTSFQFNAGAFTHNTWLQPSNHHTWWGVLT